MILRRRKEAIKASSSRVKKVVVSSQKDFWTEDPLGQFPLHQCEVLRLRFVEHLASAVIAQRLGLSEAVLRTQRSRARKLQLSEEGKEWSRCFGVLHGGFCIDCRQSAILSVCVGSQRPIDHY